MTKKTKDKAQITFLPPEQPAEEIPDTASNVIEFPLIERALALKASPEVIKELMALERSWRNDRAQRAFDLARAAAAKQLATVIIPKTKAVFLKSGNNAAYHYEDLANCKRVCDPILADHGLSTHWRTVDLPDGKHRVTCVLRHFLGHSEESTMAGLPDVTGAKNAVQGLGSTITYLERYTYKAIVGIAASEDDDAQAAGSPAGDLPISP